MLKCTTMKKRAGRTVKVSVSIDKDDFDLLKKRAKQVSGGNISAALTEMIRIAREWEGREVLATWLGEGRDDPSLETMNAIRAEWQSGRRRASKKSKVA